VKVSEATLNGFPSRDIANRFEGEPYRFLWDGSMKPERFPFGRGPVFEPQTIPQPRKNMA
jgi:hypothetical protein